MGEEGRNAVERARQKLGLPPKEGSSDDSTVTTDTNVTTNTETSTENTNSSLVQFEIEDHLGDKHKVDLDMSNREIIKDIVTKAKKVDIMKEDLEALEAELNAIRLRDKESKKQLEKLNKFAGLKGAELVDAVMADEGGLAALKDEWRKEFEESLNLSPEEKAERERKKKDEAFLREIKNLQDQLKNKDEQELVKKRGEEEQIFVNDMKDSYNSFKLQGDSKTVKALNREMVEEVKEALREKKSRGIVLNKAIINREFRKVAAQYQKEYKSETAKIVSDGVNKQIDSATSNAQLHGSQKSSGAESPADMLDRWQKMISEDKLREVIREVGKDPKKAELFLKFKKQRK